MKGIVITTDLKIYTMDFGQPLYKTVAQTIDGWFDSFQPRGLDLPVCVIYNEDGLKRGLPLNAVGSLWHGTIQHERVIAGNIVVMAYDYVDDEPDIVGLTDEEIRQVKEMAMKACGGMLVDADERVKE